jgi:hypothetical protein
MMVPYIRPEIFPLLPLLARHFRNPSASTDTLSLALKQFDQQNDKTTYLKFPMQHLESRTENKKNSRSYQAL